MEFKYWETYLRIFSINYIFLSIQEPVWNFILPGVGHDGDNLFDLQENELLIEYDSEKLDSEYNIQRHKISNAKSI